MRKEGSYTKWTPEMDAQLSELFPVNRSKDVAIIMGITTTAVVNRAHQKGLKKESAYILLRWAENIEALKKSGKAYKFEKGHKPVQTGTRLSEETKRKISASLMNRNHQRHNELTLGSERVDIHGYTRVKVEGQRLLAYKHRYLWEQAHGPIPAGHAVIFADGNRSNFDLSNLVCVSKGELAIKNNFKKYGPEIAESILLLSQIKRKLKEI